MAHPAVTPKLEQMAIAYKWSLEDLRSAKIRGHMTDYGIERIVILAKRIGVSCYTIVIMKERWETECFIPAKPSKFMKAQINYHGAPQ